jgi:hypothetical protein
MLGYLDTAGERLSIHCAVPWVTELIHEGCAGELQTGEPGPSRIDIVVEAASRPFATDGWTLLTRGARQRHGDVVVENVCTAGFDLHASCSEDRAELRFRWRPPLRDRVAARALRSRFHLLARSVLFQYPALWRAGARGRAPLHASAVETGGSSALITAPSGVGRSTLVLAELDAHGRSTGDNLAVGDGTSLWGLIEPVRIDAPGGGRRMPHGRSEIALAGRVGSITPTALVVLERGDVSAPTLVSRSRDTAARSLVTSTYMAGELRRYWSYAATLTLGTGFGPSHPAVTAVAEAFAAALPCFTLQLGDRPSGRLSELLDATRIAA